MFLTASESVFSLKCVFSKINSFIFLLNLSCTLFKTVPQLFLTSFFCPSIFSRVFRPHWFLLNQVSMGAGVSLSLSKGAEVVPPCTTLSFPDSPLLWLCSHGADLQFWKGEAGKEGGKLCFRISLHSTLSVPFSAVPPKCF